MGLLGLIPLPHQPALRFALMLSLHCPLKTGLYHWAIRIANFDGQMLPSTDADHITSQISQRHSSFFVHSSKIWQYHSFFVGSKAATVSNIEKITLHRILPCGGSAVASLSHRAALEGQ